MSLKKHIEKYAFLYNLTKKCLYEGLFCGIRAFQKTIIKYIYMKKLDFSAVCGVVLFVILLATACTDNDVKNNVYEDKGIVYAVDPLDVELSKIEKENENIFSIKGEEMTEETDEGIIRHCPVKFANDKTGEVKDTVFIIEEKY